MRFLTEACQPYDDRRGAMPPPVHISDILDRLDQYDLRLLAVCFSAADPAAFERNLLAIWAER